MKHQTNKGLKIICLNRKAGFNYFFNDLIEAGIVLKGSEIKSIRAGKVNICCRKKWWNFFNKFTYTHL